MQVLLNTHKTELNLLISLRALKITEVTVTP